MMGGCIVFDTPGAHSFDALMHCIPKAPGMVKNCYILIIIIVILFYQNNSHKSMQHIHTAISCFQ